MEKFTSSHKCEDSDLNSSLSMRLFLMSAGVQVLKKFITYSTSETDKLIARNILDRSKFCISFL